jgi:hypothetical protein
VNRRGAPSSCPCPAGLLRAATKALICRDPRKHQPAKGKAIEGQQGQRRPTAEQTSSESRRRLAAARRPAHGLRCGAAAPFSAAAGGLPDELPYREVLRQARVPALRSPDRPRLPGRVKAACGVASDGASASLDTTDQPSNAAATKGRVDALDSVHEASANRGLGAARGRFRRRRHLSRRLNR